MRTALIGIGAAMMLGGAAMAAPDPAVMSFKLPQDIPWKGDPAKGPQSYVFWGDPTKPGPYGLLVKWSPHMMSRPHTHPHERYITVLSGTWWVGTGKTYDPESTTPMPAGSSVVHFANQFHYDGAKDEPAILEIVGEGPQ